MTIEEAARQAVLRPNAPKQIGSCVCVSVNEAIRKAILDIFERLDVSTRMEFDMWDSIMWLPTDGPT